VIATCAFKTIGATYGFENASQQRGFAIYDRHSRLECSQFIINRPYLFDQDSVNPGADLPIPLERVWRSIDHP
jgi:hypothetical protein